jgi:hypothetical protein
VFFARIAALALALPSVTGAQGTTATLSGTVVDSSGAVVPGVTIAVANAETGLRRQTVTTSGGFFTFPLLQPARYTLTGRLDGFAPIEVSDIVLNVNDQLVISIRLKVAPVGESVQVLADLPRTTMSPAVGTVVDRHFVEDLPLNGRSFQRLIALTPGVVTTKASSTNTGQFSVNGQRANANAFLVDGVSGNIGASAFTSAGQGAAGSVPATASTGGLNNLVSIDALQEFQVQTSSYAPEFGRTPGAQISMITRSGTNEPHGTAFEYFRNYTLDATDWFANRSGLAKPKTRQHDFGGVAGGPVMRDHTFFFFSYERLRLQQPQVTSVSVPTVAVRDALPAQMRPYVAAMPIPNGEDLGGGLGRFSASYTNPTSLDAISGRIDHRWNESLTLFGRVSHSPTDAVQRLGALSARTETPFNTDTATIGATWIAAPTVTNDLRVNYSRSTAGSFFDVDNLGGAVAPPPWLLFPQGIGSDQGLFSFNIGAAFYNVGKSVENTQQQVNVVDALSWVRGSHHWKVGADYRRLTPFNGVRTYSQSAAFASVGTPALLTAVAPRVSISASQPGGVLFENFSAYGQDTWRIGSRATFTYGARWELNPPPSPQKGATLATVTGIDQPASIQLAPLNTPLWKTTYGNVAPRVGIAWEAAPSTVLRAGTGVFFDTGAGPSANGLSAYPNLADRTLLNVPFPLTASQAAPPAFNPGGQVSLISAPDPNLKLPVTYQWNLAVERALGAQQTLTATYVGALGRRLLRTENIVNPNPRFVQVRPIRNGGDSDYKALQLQFQRRLSNGLQALASYTWSSCHDVASDDSTLFAPLATVTAETENGPCDFDVRHASSAAVTYNIPSPRLGSALDTVLRNWWIDGMFTARSAFPLSVTVFRDLGLGSNTYRPDVVAGVPLYLNDPTAPGGTRINPAAFVIPTEVRQGTLGRNALRGFGMWQVDLAARRNLQFSQRVTVQLRAEIFNVLNHPNFGDPVTSLTSGLFGISTSTLATSLGGGGLNGGFNPLYQVGGPRSAQLGVKLLF